MNILLCGLPCSGKSTLGKKIASKLGREFVDIDLLIEKRFEELEASPLACRDIYKKYGESYFRNLEQEVVKSLTSIKEAVISLGGGTFKDHSNAAILKKLGLMVYLKVSPTTILKRFEERGYPAYIDTANPTKSLINLAQTREPLYLKYSDKVIEADRYPIDIVVKTICELVKPHHGKICAVISGPTLLEAKEQIQAAQTKADLLELRLDLIEPLEPKALLKLRKLIQIPVLFTLRTVGQGGNYAGTDKERLEKLEELAAAAPTYIDLEYDTPAIFFTHLRRQYPAIKLIASYHNFNNTPETIEPLIEALKALPVEFVKIACAAHNSLDAMRLMTAVIDKDHLIALCMGAYGQPTRILSPCIGSAWTYASIDEAQATAPGQLTIDALKSIYHNPSLDKSTAIYALLGNPLDHSQGQFIHNAAFRHFGLNAVYVKMPLEAADIPAYLKLAKKLNFQGFSVTMPLKEAIIPSLETLSPFVQQALACNTVVRNGDHFVGYNTDAAAALDALQEVTAVTGKTMVIIGAGGAAKAIAFEARNRGVNLIILNRNKEKALQLAHLLGAEAGGLDDLKSYFERGYHIIVNTTPVDLPIDPRWILPGTVAMDIRTRPIETPFLEAAAARKCTIIPGYKMWINQAVGQALAWFGTAIDPVEARKFYQQEYKKLNPSVPR